MSLRHQASTATFSLLSINNVQPPPSPPPHPFLFTPTLSHPPAPRALSAPLRAIFPSPFMYTDSLPFGLRALSSTRSDFPRDSLSGYLLPPRRNGSATRDTIKRVSKSKLTIRISKYDTERSARFFLYFTSWPTRRFDLSNSQGLFNICIMYSGGDRNHSAAIEMTIENADDRESGSLNFGGCRFLRQRAICIHTSRLIGTSVLQTNEGHS